MSQLKKHLDPMFRLPGFEAGALKPPFENLYYWRENDTSPVNVCNHQQVVQKVNQVKFEHRQKQDSMSFK